MKGKSKIRRKMKKGRKRRKKNENKKRERSEKRKEKGISNYIYIFLFQPKKIKFHLTKSSFLYEHDNYQIALSLNTAHFQSECSLFPNYV